MKYNHPDQWLTNFKLCPIESFHFLVSFLFFLTVKTKEKELRGKKLTQNLIVVGHPETSQKGITFHKVNIHLL